MKTGNLQWVVNEQSTYQKHKKNQSTHSQTISRALDRLFVFALHYDWLFSQIASLFRHIAKIQCSLSVRSTANRNFQFRFEGCTFLEFGAGLGLCSIVVGRVAKKVFCTGMQLSRTNLLLEVSLNVFPWKRQMKVHKLRSAGCYACPSRQFCTWVERDDIESTTEWQDETSAPSWFC